MALRMNRIKLTNVATAMVAALIASPTDGSA